MRPSPLGRRVGHPAARRAPGRPPSRPRRSPPCVTSSCAACAPMAFCACADSSASGAPRAGEGRRTHSECAGTSGGQQRERTVEGQSLFGVQRKGEQGGLRSAAAGLLFLIAHGGVDGQSGLLGGDNSSVLQTRGRGELEIGAIRQLRAMCSGHGDVLGGKLQSIQRCRWSS